MTDETTHLLRDSHDGRADAAQLEADLREALLERDVARAEAEAFAEASRVVSQTARTAVDPHRPEVGAVLQLIAELRAEIAADTETLRDLFERELAHLREDVASARAVIEERDAELLELTTMRARLEQVEGSRAWKALTSYRRVRSRMSRRTGSPGR